MTKELKKRFIIGGIVAVSIGIGALINTYNSSVRRELEHQKYLESLPQGFIGETRINTSLRDIGSLQAKVSKEGTNFSIDIEGAHYIYTADYRLLKVDSVDGSKLSKVVNNPYAGISAGMLNGAVVQGLYEVLLEAREKTVTSTKSE